jgi:hypothetical protein
MAVPSKKVLIGTKINKYATKKKHDDCNVEKKGMGREGKRNIPDIYVACKRANYYLSLGLT